MTEPSVPTRRSFIWVAGAALSAPLAAAAAYTSPGATTDDDPRARLAMLEDLDAIRALNHAYARHLNAASHDELSALFADPTLAAIDPEIRGLAADGFGEQDVIEIATDGRTATSRLHCVVRAESAIEPSCSLVEMARAQGGGVVRRTEHRVLDHQYVKRDGQWRILRSTYTAVITPCPGSTTVPTRGTHPSLAPCPAR